MSKFTAELLAKHSVKVEDLHLPAGGVAIFGRTGTGKSSLFYNSVAIKTVMIADTGSQAHQLYSRGRCEIVNALADKSPIDQIYDEIARTHKEGGIGLLDSFSTLQEQQVLWFKRANKIKTTLTIPQHGIVVGQLRDLVLTLAQSPWFTIFNTTAGGENKTPTGEIVRYPAGAITGYQSLNGTEPNKETILARWGNVWGMFQGWAPKQIPRGLYVPANDIRPEGHEKYAPLKDPLMVLRDTSPNQAGIMTVPNLQDAENAGRSFIDELLIEIAAKWPRRRPEPVANGTPNRVENAEPARRAPRTS